MNTAFPPVRLMLLIIQNIGLKWFIWGNALDLFEQQNLQWDWVTVPTLEMIRFCIH